MIRTLLCFAMVTAASATFADESMSFMCGELANAFGPFDYRSEVGKTVGSDGGHSNIQLVEGAHFTPEVEALVRGKTSTTAGHDIDYTLRAFPNHHRALLAMMNLSFKEKKTKPVGSRYSIDCWFERGARWRPDDAVVKMLWGIYKLKTGRQQEAVDLFQQAEKAETEDPNLYYNLGLAYFELKRYDDALRYAHKAYALNYPLPGLREKLKRAGAWRDMPPPAAEQSAPVATQSAPAALQSQPVVPQSAPAAAAPPKTP